MLTRTINQLGPMVRQLDVSTAANTAVVVTVPAHPQQYNYLHSLQWSYDGAPTGGKLTVQDGAAGTVIWEQAITAGGPGGQDPDVVGSLNTALVVTLAAGGAGVTGRLAAVRTIRVQSVT